MLTDNDNRQEYIGSNIRDYDEIRVLKQNGFYGVTLPVSVRIQGTTAATAANYAAPFFIANRAYYVVLADERHETAGTDGNPVTLQLRKVPSGTAPASGTALFSTALSLKTTANTNQSGTIVETLTNGLLDRVLVDGDSLALTTSGTLTDVAGVTVSVLLKAI